MQYLTNINFHEIIPFINWTYFFRTWKMGGQCDALTPLSSRSEKAEEKSKLFQDAQAMLARFADEKNIQINAAFTILPARSNGNDITVLYNGKEIILPMLRQQQPSNDGFCYSLADFLTERDDEIGIFACAVIGADEAAKKHEQENDLYNSLLTQTLADRLAEAASEWLHFQVRKKFWAYHPDEELNVEQIFKKQYPGIRPAVGYPSLPDQSIIFDLDTILKLNTIGIKLTENGTMLPAASICGLYFAHPKSKYFIVGKIDHSQLADYASRRGKTAEEIKKWLAGIF